MVDRLECPARGGKPADGGVDLIARKNGETTVVQCKHWQAWKAGLMPVREQLE